MKQRKSNKKNELSKTISALKTFLKQDLREFLDSNHWRYKQISQKDLTFFVKLFNGLDNIYQINDFYFFNQIEKIKTKYILNNKSRKILIGEIAKFYKKIYIKYKYDFFKDSLKITPYHLQWNYFVKNIYEDYTFIKYNPKNIPFGKQKICLWVQGLNKISTLKKKQTIFAINLTDLNSEYSEILLKYLFSGANGILCYHDKATNYLKDALKFIYKAKTTPNYPNPNLYYLNNAEAVMIKKEIYSRKNLTSFSINNRLTWIRMFLTWLKKSNLVKFDELFFEYIIGEDPRKEKTATFISNFEISLLTKSFYAKASESLLNKMMLVIFLLLILTPFRIAQIITMKIDCLQPTINPSQYIIHQQTKTTHGRKQSYPVGPKIWQPLSQIIKEGQEIRQKAIVEEYREYVFTNMTYIGDVRPLQRDAFTDYLKKICKENNMQAYSPQDLRSTYMTHCRNYCTKYSKTEFEMQSLTNHSKLETTRKFYIALEIEKMVEASLGYTFENNDLHDPTNNIIDSIPYGIKNNIVENGCGNCSSKFCVLKYGLPCLVCENFRTTVEHIPYFEKQIQILKCAQSKMQYRHDVEDTKTMIILYATYLKCLYIKKAENTEGDKRWKN